MTLFRSILSISVTVSAILGLGEISHAASTKFEERLGSCISREQADLRAQRLNYLNRLSSSLSDSEKAYYAEPKSGDLGAIAAKCLREMKANQESQDGYRIDEGGGELWLDELPLAK